MKPAILLVVFLSACAAPIAQSESSNIKIEEKENPADKYIGMTEDAALMLAEIEGYVPRILIRDGKWASRLGDAAHGRRINFNIEKGIVTNAALD